MKNLRKPLHIVLLGLGTNMILLVPAFPQQGTGQVKITDTRIEIHPGAKISETDIKALNDVLNKYKESLYKVETVKDGKAKVKGQLEDIHIDAKLAAEAKQAQAAGASVQMVQVVDHRQNVPPPAGGQLISSKELIKELKPILEKYSKK